MQTSTLRMIIAGENCYGSEYATNEATHWALDHKISQPNNLIRKHASKLQRATLFHGSQQTTTYQREIIHEQ
jgi:hypothetical protein